MRRITNKLHTVCDNRLQDLGYVSPPMAKVSNRLSKYYVPDI